MVVVVVVVVVVVMVVMVVEVVVMVVVVVVVVVVVEVVVVVVVMMMLTNSPSIFPSAKTSQHFQKQRHQIRQHDPRRHSRFALRRHRHLGQQCRPEHSSASCIAPMPPPPAGIICSQAF